MLKDKIKKLGKKEENGQKKLENIVFLIVILIITIIIINVILKQGKDNNYKDKNEIDEDKVLATDSNVNEKNSNELNKNLEQILSTIKGVGKVHVFINYSQSSKTVAMYDEKTTSTVAEETDSQGGLRNTTSTETQKDVIYTDANGNKEPVTESVIMPTIEGAIITAEGASNANVKTDIINAVQAATGLTIDKIQVFEINK